MIVNMVKLAVVGVSLLLEDMFKGFTTTNKKLPYIVFDGEATIYY